MSPVKRRKGEAQDAPSTIEEAVEMIAHYHALTLAIEELKADAAAAIARIDAGRDSVVAPLEEKAKALFARLRIWWAVAGDNLTEGKRKSIDLAGCKIGIRTSTPRLNLPKGLKIAAALDWIKGLADGIGLPFIRTKEEIDKQALIKLLGSDEDARASTFALKGFCLSQTEEFFIDTAQRGDADPAIEEAAQ